MRRTASAPALATSIVLGKPPLAAPQCPDIRRENQRTCATSSLTAKLARARDVGTMKIAGIILIVLGALGLAYGQFSYTKDSHDVKVGPVELSVKEKETVNVPSWAGGGAIALGIVLLVIGRKK